jgi:hypothetical protein
MNPTVCKLSARSSTEDGTTSSTALGKVRQKAIEMATENNQADMIQDLALLQNRDLRRSCVVLLGESNKSISAITGHKFETNNKILEVYMPRTEAMAARAVVTRNGERKAAADQKLDIRL